MAKLAPHNSRTAQMMTRAAGKGTLAPQAENLEGTPAPEHPAPTTVPAEGPKVRSTTRW